MTATHGIRVTRRIRSVLLVIVLAATASTAAATSASAQTTHGKEQGHGQGQGQGQGQGHESTQLAAKLATRQTFAVPSGTASVTLSVGSVHVSVARANVSPRITCTLTAYAPYWWSTSPQGNVIVASAAVQCDATVSGIAIGEGLYDGTTGNLLGSTSSTAYNTNFILGQYNYPLARNGWFVTGAVGYVGAPINGSFNQVTSPETYVSAPIP